MKQITGVAIRNSDGNLVLAFGQRILKSLTFEHAELEALKGWVQLACARGFRGVHVRSDSNMVVKPVMYPSNDLGDVGMYALEVNKLLMSLTVASIKHIVLSANFIVHFLA